MRARIDAHWEISNALCLCSQQSKKLGVSQPAQLWNSPPAPTFDCFSSFMRDEIAPYVPIIYCFIINRTRCLGKSG